MNFIQRRRWLTSGTGGGGAPLLPFSDDFARADGDLANGWEYTAGKWTIASGAAVGTPGLGANLIVNSGFDSDTAWFKEADWTIAAGLGTKAAGAATREIRQTVLTVGKWYRADWQIAAYAAGIINVARFLSNTPSRTATGTYLDTGICTLTNATLQGFATADGSIDNVTYKEITKADALCTRELGSASVDVAVPLTLVAGALSGIIICLDSVSAPANFIFAYHTSSLAVLGKCVAGTHSVLVSAAATYGDGRILRVVKNGNTVQLFYHGVQIGLDQTVNDAGITSNTRHGMFSFAPENSIAEFSAANP